MSDRDKLRDIGESLYGPRWQTDVARLVGVDPRYVRQWMADERPIPADAWLKLFKESKTRAEKLRSISDES